MTIAPSTDRPDRPGRLEQLEQPERPARAPRLRPERVVWRRPSGGPRRVRGTATVLALATLIGAAVSVRAVRAGTVFDYGDAMAHLTIAQRITESRSPGLSQLGTVWLPLPHLLLMPLVRNDWLFHSGAAGSILGSLCLGVTAAALWRIMARLGLAGPARVVGLAVLAADPAYLYVSTTALTEPVLMAALTMAVAGLAGWTFSPRRLSGGELAVFAGLPTAMAVLTRYEGWALMVSGSVFVLVVVLRRGDPWRRAVGLAACFAAPSLTAVGWWLAYNTAVYGTPFEFLTGQYAASGYTATFAASGRLTTIHDPGLSAQVLGSAMLSNLGLAAMVLAGVGLLVMTWCWGLSDRALVVWLGGTSAGFLLVALIGGQQVMLDRASLPVGSYNTRNVLSALPWVALLTAVLVGLLGQRGLGSAPGSDDEPARLRRGVTAVLVAVVAVALTAQTVWWLRAPDERMTVLSEAAAQRGDYVEIKADGRWIGEHYDGGGILTDESSILIAPVIGLPQGEYVNRASGPLFDQTLADPYDHVRWVFMHRDTGGYVATASSADRVTAALANDAAFRSRFALVHASPRYLVYRRVGDPPGGTG